MTQQLMRLNPSKLEQTDVTFQCTEKPSVRCLPNPTLPPALDELFTSESRTGTQGFFCGSRFTRTQELGGDPMSDMIRQIMALFDEYQSKENAKHTLRAMKQNARQGFWNGALPPDRLPRC